MKFDFCTTNAIKNSIACTLFTRPRIARPVSHLLVKPDVSHPFQLIFGYYDVEICMSHSIQSPGMISNDYNLTSAKINGRFYSKVCMILSKSSKQFIDIKNYSSHLAYSCGFNKQQPQADLGCYANITV